MTRPILALGGGEAYEWRRYMERTTVVGPWPAFERDLSAALLARVAPDRVQMIGPWAAFPGDGPGELLLARVGDGPKSWAEVRVRVTVEVLDGVL